MIDPQRIWSSQQLPTLPTVACRLLELLKDPETTIEAVTNVVKSDPAISAKLVKSANSSYFGLRSEVKDVDRAVSLLGTTISTSLTLSFVLTDDSLKAGPLAGHYRSYWKQSVVQAAAAETLAVCREGRPNGEYFLVGLLLGIGRLAMLKTIPTEYFAALERANIERLPLRDVEREMLGFDHAEIGAKLMENWKLPQSFSSALTVLNQPLADLESRNQSSALSLDLAVVMSAAVGDYYCAAAKGRALEQMRILESTLFAAKGLTLDDYLQKCESRIQRTGELFDVDVTDLGNSSELMIQANEQLVQLTLREHISNTQSQLQQAALSEEKTRLEEQNRVLQSQAIHDPLTELYNRKFFDESLAKETNRCQRQASPVAVIFADVDRFKQLNDTHGHAFGDFVLREIAQRFKDSVRNSDIVARYGGEELVILVHQPTEKGLETLANRIREKVAATPFSQGHTSVQVTCSLGAAIAIPGRRERNVGTRLLGAADEAMYSAKHSGRNRTVVTSLISHEDRQLQQQVTAHRFSRWLVQQKLLDVPAVSRALLECTVQVARIGELGVEQGYLTSEQVEQVLREQEHSEERFGAVAIRLGFLDPNQLVHLLTLQHENPKELVAATIRIGVLAPDVAARAYEQYTRENLPALATSTMT